MVSSSSGNPFVGNWSGTVSFKGESTSASCSITETTWTFTVPAAPDYNGQGTYTRNGNSSSFNIDGIAGTATVSGNTLTIRITGGDLAGGEGTFTK
jgi:hypothetical protein